VPFEFVYTRRLLTRHRFEHARLLLLQYKTCRDQNVDGTVDIPIAVESLYGYVFAKLVAKHAAKWTPRANIAIAAEMNIASTRALAVNALVDRPFPLKYELSSNMLQTYQPSVFSVNPVEVSVRQGVESGLSGLSFLQRSATDPGTNEDCNLEALTGTWQYIPQSFDPMANTAEKCCATACHGGLVTVGDSPTGPMRSACCMECNKFNCDAATSDIKSAVLLMTTLQVPSPSNGIATAVSINL
jgi:hypothetical protein